MTSASELFYTRRSRSGRPDPGSVFDSSLDLHHNLIRRQNHACAPSIRRSSLSTHYSPRSSPHSERSSMRHSENSRQVEASTGGNGEAGRSLSRPVLIPRERLPGAVLLAKARLLERLRGVSFPENRRSSRAADRREHIFGDEFRVVDAGDWGMSLHDLPSVARERRERVGLVQERNGKPSGLTETAVDRLQFEVTKMGSNESGDCSICLEGFVEGNKVIRLCCGHRFHSDCLLPWVTTCGDCPYCRQPLT